MSEIKYAYPLILNKVASPQYATATLRRARLIDWLNAAANCRAVVIAADAGYGKTTLLWQWEREVNFPCYWYKLDRSDRDWTFHISYLIEAIAKRHPGFGTRAHSMLRQLGGPGSSRPGVAAYLLAEMHERLTEPCTFIIDDWHYVNAVTEVRGLWNQILRDAPPTCRFVFSSRAKPKLQFARFKTQGGYAELGTDDLRFTSDEAGDLFGAVYHNPLNESELVEIDRRTEGWAVSLQLVQVRLRRHTAPQDRRAFFDSIGGAADSDLFDFLAEEVLDQQNDETRNFLLATSILHQMTPEVAERLAGVFDGRRALVELETNGLFTYRLDDSRFRYHHLFREFLERRLAELRTPTELSGLHIHAASYFETSQQWPEAIHHYLAAGLQRQAARLIANHGETVATEARLGLVDEWLARLPMRTIRQHARLSLLHGETSSMRGNWGVATASLKRARDYFRRKGDRRMEALACLKLSSMLANYGDTEAAADVAQAGLALVPSDDSATRLRLEGNLAITRTWTHEPIAEVIRECLRIAAEAYALGLEHYAAIAHVNAGIALLKAGRIADAVRNLRRASRIWGTQPTSPFADNSDLVLALLAEGSIDEARAVADEATRRTRPWPRPLAEARSGRAAVLASSGDFDGAARELSESSTGSIAAAAHPLIAAHLVEYLVLAGADRAQIRAALDLLEQMPRDGRYELERAVATAVGRHSMECAGSCGEHLPLVRRHADERLTNAVVDVKLGWLALEHSGGRAPEAWRAVGAAHEMSLLPLVRYWLRRYAPFAAKAPSRTRGNLVVALLQADPEGWRHTVYELLAGAAPAERDSYLAVIVRHADAHTIEHLRQVPGHDVRAARRQIQTARAARLFVRSFGGISIHRGAWNGPEIKIDKRRVRGLLGVLSAHSSVPLSRDAAIELLWPEADATAGVNNLNQTVFQLRRYLDPGYRAGESPEYVFSSSDEIRLSDELVRTDLGFVTKLRDKLSHDSAKRRSDAVATAADLIRGEFVEDLRYEEWASRIQRSVHDDVRGVLLPFADGTDPTMPAEIRARAASALVRLDPYDEPAVVALARAFSLAGRRVAARRLLEDFALRVRTELEEEPSEALRSAAALVGSDLRSSILT